MSKDNRYATTHEMVIEHIGIGGTLRAVAIDEKGLYITPVERVGRPLADVNRYGVDRIEFIRELEALEMDPEVLFETHKHLIPKTTGRTNPKKMVNPIKASKRGLG